MAQLAIFIDSTYSAADLQARIRSGQGRGREELRAVADLILGMSSGTQSGSQIAGFIGSPSAGRITLGSNVSVDDTFVLGAVTFTAKASAANDTQFTIGISKEATASNIAAAVNACNDDSVYGQVVAIATGAVIDFYQTNVGEPETVITLTSSLTGATADAFTGGAVTNSFNVRI